MKNYSELNLTGYLSQSSTQNATERFGSPSPRAWIMLVIMACTLFANGIFMIAYVRNRHLRTPFSVYLVALSMADMSQALFVDPGVLVTNLSNVWPLGSVLCSLYQYAIFTVFGSQFAIHLMISLNRLWAVTLPVHYRQYHNRKVAVAVSLGTLLYANAWVLPAVIQDALYYRNQARICRFNYEAQGMWAFWVNIWMYDFPELTILVVYPIIMWKSCERRKRRSLNKIQPTSSSQPAIPTLPSINVSFDHSGPESIRHPIAKSVKATRAGASYNNLLGGQPYLAPSHTTTLTRKKSSDPMVHAAKLRNNQVHIQVLSLLVIGMVVFWTPICTYFTITGFTRYYNFTFVQVANYLYHANALLNPFVYPLASPEWRRAFKQVLHL